MRPRAGFRAGWLVAALCLSAGAAHADKKKKEPGFFDFKSWLPGSHERDAVRRLTPDGVDRSPVVAQQGDARVIRMRVYADKDYRALTIRWQARMRTQVQRLNAVIGPMFNTRFEIEAMREWDRGHAGAALGGAMVDELVALDDGREVDLVVGLVTPLTGVATSAHDVGWAASLSRHLVLRGMDDEQEFRLFEREFKLITSEERQRLYADRKAHKEVVIFLHEWGHTLGLLHHQDVRCIMNPAYDARQAEFSEYEKRMLALVIDRRLAARDAPHPEAADLLPLVEAMPVEEGSDAERARLLNLVRRLAAYRPAKPEVRERKDTVDLSDADIGAFNKAVAALRGGQAEDAWKLLAPVIEHAAARKVGGYTWFRIAELAVGIGALTRADEAAGRAGASADAQKIVSDIESTRHRIALPLDAAKFGVPPDREPAYVAGYWQTARLVDGPDAGAARAQLDQLAAAFPDAPGVAVLTCDLELKVKHTAAAAKHCEAALAKFKGATRAHVLLAVIAMGARRGAVAEQHLRQAILLDPTDPTGWRLLARHYRNTRASKRLADLAAEHQAWLSSPLPE